MIILLSMIILKMNPLDQNVNMGTKENQNLPQNPIKVEKTIIGEKERQEGIVNLIRDFNS